MQVQHIGYRIRGGYRVAALGHLWDMTPNDAQQRLNILKFWNKHGLVATVDAFGGARRTRSRWRKQRADAPGTRRHWRPSPVPQATPHTQDRSSAGL